MKAGEELFISAKQKKEIIAPLNLEVRTLIMKAGWEQEKFNWNNNILASEDGYAIDAACYLNNRNFLPNLIENKSSPLTGRILKFRALDDSLQNLLEKSITPEGRIVLEENIFTVVNDIKKAIYFSNAQLGLIHCDVSPDNILIKYKNGASKKIEKVLLHDFGCAKKSEELENGEGRGGKFLYYLPYIPEKTL